MAIKNNNEILLETGTNEVEIAEFQIYLKDKKDIKQSFGINVAKVREIIKTPKFVSLPQANKNILGVFKLREKIIPLINLAGWLNERTDDIELSNCFVIVTEFNNVNFGFLIHGIETIHRISWSKVLPPSSITDNIKEDCITGVISFEDRIMMMLDFEKVVSDMNPELSLKIKTDKDMIENIKKFKGDKPKVLLAEDSGIIRDLLAGILEKGGFEVVHVNNGKLALEYLNAFVEEANKQKKEIDDMIELVITDIEMPQMDGHSLCKKIKEDPILKNLPVVLFSSLIYDEIRKKGEMIGADAQISKPEIGNLLKIVSDLLDKKKKEIKI